MRHQVKGRKLGRTTPHRKATLQALSVALIKEKRIKTTLPKAKELRRFVEPIITKGKNDTTHNRRQVFGSLRDKFAVTELFEMIAPEVGDRPGGYTRVLKLGTRLGDSAEMAVIELVDFNDEKPEKKESKKKRTRRAGKSNKAVDEQETPKPAKKESKKAEENKADEPEAIEETKDAKAITEAEDSSADKEEASEKTKAEATEEATAGEGNSEEESEEKK